ncbi:6-phosphofructokinase [Rubritalea marina]|uniref:6-phosphofructokinase n=1 Tax=Rubritalea marina TaxID=361055 RepID=UPI000378AC09|nr:ATP-dependent 6-phosphofructokinase [Rubritalea marina]
MRIGILNSGGDCPGLNAVIHGVVGAASKLNMEVVGFRDGFEGLLDGGEHVILNPIDTIGIMKLGGTILGTTNKNHFVKKVGVEDIKDIAQTLVTETKATMKELEIEALIVVGGDGTLSTALHLYNEGIPVIGVPKTIDNDLQATAMTFGFDSAVSCVVDALDRLHTTAVSHKRVMVVEVMGRSAGWIALWGGVAGGANIVLIPEIEFDFEKVAKKIKEREEKGFYSTMIVVAEGAHLPEGDQITKSTVGKSVRFGGIGEVVAERIAKMTGKETRACTLGHLQRGGEPTSLDRILGARFGVKAIELAKEKQFGRMVSYQSYQVSSVTIAKAVHQLRTVDPHGEVVTTARAIGISMGDED